MFKQLFDREVITVEPSTVFVDVEIGDVVIAEGKLYCLIQRDPWRAYVVRYYWFDPFLARLYEWRKSRKLRVYEDKDRT